MSISQTDRVFIEAHAYTYDHNFSFYSLILGEPFFRNGLIHYFDGRLLSICTYLVEENSNKVNEESLRMTILDIISFFEPEAIDIWGPYSDVYILPVPEGWLHHPLANPEEFHRDIVILLPSFNPSKVPHLHKSISYAEKNGVRIVAQRLGQLSARHITLLEGLAVRPDVHLFDRIFYSTIAYWSIISRPLAFEAWRDNELLGYLILDESLPNLPICLAVFAVRKPAVVSDILYNAMFHYCIRVGYQRISLGHSYNEGLYTYKEKWGQSLVQAGFWESFLASPDSSISPARNPWLSRIL